MGFIIQCACNKDLVTVLIMKDLISLIILSTGSNIGSFKVILLCKILSVAVSSPLACLVGVN